MLLKGRAEPMRGPRLSIRLIESRHCVVCSMGLRYLVIDWENVKYRMYHPILVFLKNSLWIQKDSKRYQWYVISFYTTEIFVTMEIFSSETETQCIKGWSFEWASWSHFFLIIIIFCVMLVFSGRKWEKKPPRNKIFWCKEDLNISLIPIIHIECFKK